jgi:apolipoprotein N-acyltransferase
MKDWKYRLEQSVILVAHFILLYWMLYVLREGGILPTKDLIFHFIGMAIFGGLIIRGTALWAKIRTEQRKARDQGEDAP